MKGWNDMAQVLAGVKIASTEGGNCRRIAKGSSPEGEWASVNGAIRMVGGPFGSGVRTER